MKYLVTTSKYILLVSVLAVFLFSGCGKKSGSPESGGIAISFDDHFISEWYALRPLFQKYGAKVTFFVTCPDSLNAAEVQMLKTLQNDGHEIGFHGTIHGRSTDLIKAGKAHYVQTELAPGLTHMRAAGFNPISYAHPGGNHNEEVDAILFENGFKILRDVAISRRKLFGIQLYALAPRWMSWIFYDFDQNKTVDALLIDTDSNVTEREIQEAAAKAKKEGSALMLFGHEPLYAAPQGGKYGFSVTFLEKIFKAANQQHLKYYTMSELPAQH